VCTFGGAAGTGRIGGATTTARVNDNVEGETRATKSERGR
jgi:hypothetical protein